MLNKLFGVGKAVLGSIGLKPLKYFIDSTFRQKVTPVAGSVVYCDLWVGAEHSGIYLDKGEMANIEVQGVAQAEVKLSNARSFTSKSVLGKKIYVSCNGYGAVGHKLTAEHAHSRLGEKSFYGLVFKNCHEFSRDCVEQAPEQADFIDNMVNWAVGIFDTEWEATIRALKRQARNHLGATKWLLWDWEGNEQKAEEPDWQKQQDFFQNQPLTPEFMDFLHAQLLETQAYQQEITDENIPQQVLAKLQGFEKQLQEVSDLYEKAKPLLKANPDMPLSYNDLKASNLDFTKLAEELAQNRAIQKLIHQLGRNYISEERKKQKRVPSAAQNEVHGTHLSNDLMRLLPTELVNMDDNELEMLFYARLLEHNLQSYELSGTEWKDKQEIENADKRGGPVVACLDTSGSMACEPLQKAQALLFAIAGILKKEQRSLHVLLFGDNGQIKEYKMTKAEEIAGLLKFLNNQFNGGTDFVTPLKRACEIITNEGDYQKADILMISDGDCTLPNDFVSTLKLQKEKLDCSIYSVLCNGKRAEDPFSDEVLVL